MNRFMDGLINSVRHLLAEFFGQIFAFFAFCIAGLAWLYFSTIYAVIPVLILGVFLGGYLYELVEGDKKEDAKKIKDGSR